MMMERDHGLYNNDNDNIIVTKNHVEVTYFKQSSDRHPEDLISAALRD